MLGPLEGRRVLDLFAGSGALGIEAASRGAEAVVFADSDPRAVASIRANLDAVGIDAPVYRRDALDFLADLRRRDEPPFDLVFLDPPYSSADRVAGPLAERLPAVLSDDAMVVTESDKRNPIALPLPVVRERTYGDTRIALHRGT